MVIFTIGLHVIIGLIKDSLNIGSLEIALTFTYYEDEGFWIQHITNILIERHFPKHGRIVIDIQNSDFHPCLLSARIILCIVLGGHLKRVQLLLFTIEMPAIKLEDGTGTRQNN